MTGRDFLKDVLIGDTVTDQRYETRRQAKKRCRAAVSCASAFRNGFKFENVLNKVRGHRRCRSSHRVNFVKTPSAQSLSTLTKKSGPRWPSTSAVYVAVISNNVIKAHGGKDAQRVNCKINQTKAKSMRTPETLGGQLNMTAPVSSRSINITSV